MESSAYYRLNYDNSKIVNNTTSSDYALSDLNTDRNSNTGADWKNRIKQKNSCTVFRKRSQSGIAKTTEMSTENLDGLSVIDLKDQLNSREKYLQNLIERIVITEEDHLKQMNEIDNQYSKQIEQLHQMLKEAVERNRQLEKHLFHSSQRSPRLSCDSLLLGDSK